MSVLAKFPIWWLFVDEASMTTGNEATMITGDEAPMIVATALTSTALCRGNRCGARA